MRYLGSLYIIKIPSNHDKFFNCVGKNRELKINV